MLAALTVYVVLFVENVDTVEFTETTTTFAVPIVVAFVVALDVTTNPVVIILVFLVNVVTPVSVVVPLNVVFGATVKSVPENTVFVMLTENSCPDTVTVFCELLVVTFSTPALRVVPASTTLALAIIDAV